MFPNQMHRNIRLNYDVAGRPNHIVRVRFSLCATRATHHTAEHVRSQRNRHTHAVNGQDRAMCRCVCVCGFNLDATLAADDDYNDNDNKAAIRLDTTATATDTTTTMTTTAITNHNRSPIECHGKRATSSLYRLRTCRRRLGISKPHSCGRSVCTMAGCTTSQ